SGSIATARVSARLVSCLPGCPCLDLQTWEAATRRNEFHAVKKPGPFSAQNSSRLGVRMNQDASRSAASMTKNRHLIRWVEKMAELTQPAAIHWVDGSRQEYDSLCEEMVASGTLIRLNAEKWPECFYARSDPKDVARVEERTFICSLSKDAAGPTNNWVDPFEMRRKLKALFRGSMSGRTMYVLPF